MRTQLRWTLLSLLFGKLLGEATVNQAVTNATYTGVLVDGVEIFYSISYGQDTGGENRFKVPQPYLPQVGSVINATVPGPKCPQSQSTADTFIPLYLSNVTEVSEDCLHLNVYRAPGTCPDDALPVMIYIHGGSFIIGSKDELVIQPGGLVLESVAMGQPVIVVTINYRPGVFGFAQSEALSAEGSTNMGLRDQRLAIDWVADNIASFGGNSSRIEILGQSSGGLAMGMQMLAYGGAQGFSFHQVSAESQILEGGITGNFTLHAMQRIVGPVGCNNTDLQSAETIACLRALSTEELLDAQTATHHDGPDANIGDEWLPMVDGDFLPAAPSQLIAEGRFAHVTLMSGWCEGDGNFFVRTPETDADVHEFFTAYLPGMTAENVNEMLALYPNSDFSANPAANLSAQVYRAGRILRDILFVCQPIHFGQALGAAGENVYFWAQNQTMLDEILVYLGEPGYGVVHTSNFAYQFHNLSHYDVDGFPYHPNASDFALADRQSRTWASFANSGLPSVSGLGTLASWTSAFGNDAEIDIFVIGGPDEGLTASGGPTASNEGFADEKLAQRCAFFNSPEIIQQLDY